MGGLSSSRCSIFLLENFQTFPTNYRTPHFHAMSFLATRSRLNKGTSVKFFLIVIVILTDFLFRTPYSFADHSSIAPELSSDLPVEGISAFDSIFGEWEGTDFRYNLPPDFESLITKLEDYGKPVASLIPFGRSLQRPFSIKVPENFDSAYERFWANASGREKRSSVEELRAQNILFNPFRFPRVVIALEKQQEKAFPGFLFLGYLEPTNQIEVISFNRALRRMEFQIVSDFKRGGRPKVEYVKRQKCLRCHISGGPIFSRNFWNEGTNSSRVQSLIRQAMSGDNFSSLLDSQDEMKYHGIPINSPNGFSIEALVNSASQALLTSIVWPRLCASQSLKLELQCKRSFLKKVLDTEQASYEIPMGTFPDNETYERFVAPIIDPLFKNRIIFPELGEIRGESEEEQNSEILTRRLGDLADLVRDIPEDLDPRQALLLNPGYRHQSTLVSTIRHGVGLRNEPSLTELAYEERLAALDQAVNSIPDSLLLKRYFDFERIRWSIRTALNLPVAEPAQSRRLPKNLLHQRHYLTGDLAPFERSCTRCHTGPSSFPPAFLYGQNEQEVVTSILANKNLILAYTEPEKPAMPPVHDSYTQSDLEKIRAYVTNINQSQATSEFASISCQDYQPMSSSIDLDSTEDISDSTGMQMLNHYCTQCHGQNSIWPPSIGLDNLERVRTNSSQISSFLEQATMPHCDWLPQNGAPSDEERKQLIKWLRF